MEHLFLILVAIVFGALFGNFATTFYFRLPRGIPINGGRIGIEGKAPHCSSCAHQLKFYEYLPILNLFSTSGKCNYCGVKIDGTYHFLEIGGILTAIALLYFQDINMGFVAKLPFAVLLMLIATLYNSYKQFYHELTILMLGIVLAQQNLLIPFTIFIIVLLFSICYKRLNIPWLMQFIMLAFWVAIICIG